MGIFNVNNLKFGQMQPYRGWEETSPAFDATDTTSIFSSNFSQAENNTFEITKNDDKEIIYESNGVKKIFEKRPNSDIPASIKIIDTNSEELAYVQTFYDEEGNEVSKIEKYKPEQSVQSRETFFDKDKKISYQKELFRGDENIKQREYFYEDGVNETIKTTLKDGSFVIEKPQLGAHKVYIPASDFGKSNVNIYLLDEENNTKTVAGDIFNNELGVTLEDLHMPSLEEGNFSNPNSPVVMTSPQIRGLQIGYFIGNKFISYSKQDNITAKNIYALDQNGNPSRIEKSLFGNSVTEYTYNDKGSQEVTSVEGEVVYLTVKDASKNTETRYYKADRGRPFSRTRTDRKGRQIKEFYNAKTNKWSKDFPYTNISRMTPEKRAEIPLGAKFITDIPGVRNPIEVEKVEADIMGNNVEAYKSSYINPVTKTEITQIYEIMPDGACGNRIMLQIGDEPPVYYIYNDKDKSVIEYKQTANGSYTGTYIKNYIGYVS